ncbi:MAG: TIGR04222 domain-containing membrane protein [Nostoc sp.]|uniref:TIGR04222 domain-containing membrane protein n=1 Tax=Nostoc sp. TaxID=1180 RepID=UPI002FFBEF54
MNALLHNPIADMYGVDFLLFYCSVIGITLVVCWQLIKDPTKNQPLPLIPAKPDPYEIAYLRSQETGIANVALFDLIVRGYLQVNQQSISQVANHPDVSQLQPIEREVFDRLSSSSRAKTSLSLATESIQLYCNAYKEKLQNEQLLYAFQWQIKNIIVVLIGAMIIFSLWGYKLLIALGKGGHENFLITISVLSIIFLRGFVSDLLQGFFSNRSHLSQRGKVYLQQLKATFSRLQQKVENEIPSVFDYNLVVALFGVEALAGTSYDSYYKAFFPPTFSRTASRGSRSSGSSCSSSSDSGSSCSISSSDSSCSSSSSSSSSDSGSSCSSSSCSSSSDSGSSCSSSSCSSSSCGGGCGGG